MKIYCEDCKFYSKDLLGRLELDRCTNENVGYGNYVTRKRQAICKDTRHSDHMGHDCGPQAKYFEAKA